MAAALGLGLDPGDVVVSLGTSGTAFARNTTADRRPDGQRAGFADATGRFLPLVCTLNAARVLRAGAAMLGTDLAGLDGSRFGTPPGAGGLTLLPYLDGERTPNLPSATGSVHGLTRSNATPANLARAALEGMLLNLADGVDAVRAVGVPRAAGAAHRRCRRLDGRAGDRARPVRRAGGGAEPGEYVAVGAARQAAWALSGGDAPPRWEVDVDVTVDPGDTGTGRDIRARYDATVAAAYPSTVG